MIKPIKAKILIFLTALSLFVPVSHIEANQCIALFNEALDHTDASSQKFPLWSEYNLNPLKSLTSEHFFPQDFLEEVKAQGKTVTLHLDDVDTYGPSNIIKNTINTNLNSIVSFHFKDNAGQNVVQFDLWRGSEPNSVVVENLSLQNPIANKRTDRLRQSQRAKGLPPKVFFHMRNQLFKLLKAGGYKKIEVTSTNDILVYFLYNKLVGAKPADELAQKFNDYLSTIVEDTIKGKIPGFSAKSTTDFSKYIGGYFGDPVVPEEVISTWKKYQNTPVLLEDAGIEPIYDATGTVIGIKWESKVAFVVPFLPDRPVLTWKNIYDHYPALMKMIKELE